MAETDRAQRADALISYLEQNAPRVAFFQALQTLERLLPEGVALGAEGPAEEELVRVRPSLSLACPPSDIETITRRPHAAAGVQITATFLGLYGADSPLPEAFGEHLAQTSWDESGQRVRAFLDVFHHRLYSLLYRAWRKARPATGGERVDPLYDRLLALVGYDSGIGLGGAGRPRLREARLKVLRPRTASGLEAFIELRLGYRGSVRQLLPRMVIIPRQQRTRLGQGSCTLGGTFVLGTRTADHNRIAIDLRACDHPMWLELAPGGDDRCRLDGAVVDYLRDPLDYRVEVRMDAQHVAPLALGGRRGALGRDAWLGRPRGEACWSWPGTGPA